MMVYEYIYTTLLLFIFFFMYFVDLNFLLILIYIETSFLLVSITLLLYSHHLDFVNLEFFVIVIITLAGAESALAISFLINIASSTSFGRYKFSSLKGLIK